eukprot:g26097.t1
MSVSGWLGWGCISGGAGVCRSGALPLPQRWLGAREDAEAVIQRRSSRRERDRDRDRLRHRLRNLSAHVDPGGGISDRGFPRS